jgi:hypothetical protein
MWSLKVVHRHLCHTDLSRYGAYRSFFTRLFCCLFQYLYVSHFAARIMGYLLNSNHVGRRLQALREKRSWGILRYFLMALLEDVKTTESGPYVENASRFFLGSPTVTPWAYFPPILGLRLLGYLVWNRITSSSWRNFRWDKSLFLSD